MRPDPSSLSPLLRLLVRLTTPARHREALEQDLARELARARRSESRLRAARVLVREVGGLVLHGLRDRIAGSRARAGSGPRDGLPRPTGPRWARGLGMDLRVTLRRLRRAPGFTMVVTLTLALALGVTSAAFGLVDAFFLRSLSYGQPERLVALWESEPDSREITTVAPANVRDWEREARTLDGVAWFNSASVTLTGVPEAVRVPASVASVDLFDVLGVRPLLGTGFLPEHARPDTAASARVVVLSHEFWVRHFGADPGVLGRTIELNDIPYRVAGVMPADFRHPRTFLGVEPAELWVPLGLGASGSARDVRFLHVVARLAEGAAVEDARAELRSIGAALAEAYPESNAGRTVMVRPVAEQIFGDQRPVLLLLLAAAGLVLLVACVNMATLLLARGVVRDREFAVRAALGSGRWAILRQLMMEAGVLAFLGGVAGLALALASESALRRWAGPYLNPMADVRIDARVALATLAAAAGSGLLFGVLPALRLARPDLRGALGSRDPGGGHRALGGLVSVEAAVTLVLVFGAGLMGRALLDVLRTPPGFRVSRTVLFEVRPPASAYGDNEAVMGFYDRLRHTLETHPGIERTGLVSDLPLTSENRSLTFTVPASDRPDVEWSVENHAVSPGYFSAAGIPLLGGRDFTQADDPDAPRVAIVNRAMARRTWGDRSPVGEALWLPTSELEVTIVGVVGSTADDALDQVPEPRLYYPSLQSGARTFQVVARTSGPAERVLPLIRALVAEVDPRVPVARLSTMERHVAASVATPRGTTALTSFFSALALLLAAVGIYGVLAHRVANRTRELGVRAALGARRASLVRLVMKDSVRIVGVGIAAGAALSVVAGRILASQLHGVRAWDPLVLGIAMAVVALGALTAAWIPARRASRIDPLVAIRAE